MTSLFTLTQKKFLVLVLGILAAFLLFTALSVPAFAEGTSSAPEVSTLADSLKANAFGTEDIALDATGDETDIKAKVISVINKFLLFLGLILLIIIIYAGFTIITSDGDEEGLTKGRKMIIYAIIGVIIIFLSYSIVNFIGDLGTPADGTGG